jgi:dienelactone hydrolase
MIDSRLRPTRRRTCIALALLAWMPAWAQDATAFTVQDFEWSDTTRPRVVPARLYLPKALQTGASLPRVPLVVFSHGIGGSRAGYSYLGRHFASQGVASLHLQHVGSDRNLWFGNPLSLVGRLHDAAQDVEAIARVRDLRFALDQVLAGETGRQIDARHIVAAGHSYGANTTLLAAGARVERDGRLLDFRDPRIQAAIVISAPPFYGETDPAKILAGVTMPTLHITATEDIIRIPGYYSGPEDRVAVFDATGSTRKTLAVFNGGSHSVFTDRGNTGGAELNPQIKAATQALSLAFVKALVDGDAAALKAWPQRFGNLVHRFASTALN